MTMRPLRDAAQRSQSPATNNLERQPIISQRRRALGLLDRALTGNPQLFHSFNGNDTKLNFFNLVSKRTQQPHA